MQLNINLPHQTNADTLLGRLNIANITGGSAVERGIQIRSGWDSNHCTLTTQPIANSGTFLLSTMEQTPCSQSLMQEQLVT
ncbi:hypothetical protein IPH70_00580 [Candidatus Roizmanbacteria bacterium]|nr:MAG: hypothetical protein IPH70_00580 [Candidatus Roizmanbacteria bacterium]